MGEETTTTQPPGAAAPTADEPLQTVAVTLAQQAKTIEVTDQESYEHAGEIVVRLRNMEKRIHKECDPLCEKTDAAHKEATAHRQRLLDGIERARKLVKGLMDTWSQDQARKAREQQAQLQTQVARKEEDVRLSEAVAAESMGDRVAADAILAQPAPVPTVIVKPSIPKVSGVSFRTTWEPRVLDESLIPREYMTPDMVKARRVVSALKDQTKIPGIKAEPRRV